jgi:putative FmdB family regulatory protein
MGMSLARAAKRHCGACYTFLFGVKAKGAAVPLYEYKCLKCSRKTEKIEPVNGPHLKKCPHCGGKVESVISAPAIQFKGSGWYVTDYAGKSRDSGSAESKPAGEGKDAGGESGAKDSGGKEAASKETTEKSGTSKESGSKEKKAAKKK